MRQPVLVAAMLALLLVVECLADQGRAAGRTAVPPVLSNIKKAVEARFREMEANSTVKLRDVTVTPQQKGRALLHVGLTPPTDQKFEFHAESAYMLIWQALVKEKGAFQELDRVRVSLERSGQRMTIDCPIKSVEDSVGYTDSARIERDCRIS